MAEELMSPEEINQACNKGWEEARAYYKANPHKVFSIIDFYDWGKLGIAKAQLAKDKERITNLEIELQMANEELSDKAKADRLCPYVKSKN